MLLTRLLKLKRKVHLIRSVTDSIMAEWYDDLLTFINEENKDGILSMLQRLPNIPGAIERLREECAPLVMASCRKGYTDVLQFLIENDIDISNIDTQENPIQVACEFNQVSVLDFLFERGVPILPGTMKAWEEESPIYIASKCGHYDVIHKLIEKEPNLIKDDQVRNCLLYAACLGGNIDVVKMWLSPSIDINHPLQLVKRLTDCEKLTPLFAACAGGHKHVIKFLQSNCEDLQFSTAVCQAHPGIIGEYLQKYFEVEPSDNEDDFIELCTGHLQRKNLHMLHPDWFTQHPYFMTLSELDISNNRLTELPDCLPWKFQNLRCLNASRNFIKCLSYCEEAGSEEDSICPSLEEVNISYNNLESVCRELFEIQTLQHLNLSHNKLVYLSKSLLHQGAALTDSNTILKRHSSMQERHWLCLDLRKLDVSHNALVMLPTEIQACRELIHIDVNNNRLTTFPQPWSCPLEILDLSHNQLERFPVNTEQYWSGSLRYLNISHNYLDEINEGIVRLNILTDLIASNNKIERLPSPEIWECGHLHNISLKHNKLGIPIEPPKKPILRFGKPRTSSSEDTRMLHFPQSLAYCLKELRLADNNLDCVPQSVCELISLEILDLSDNPLIKVLPRELGKLKNCGMLKLKGVTPTNVSLPASGNKTKEILSELLENLRDCQPYHQIKAVVLGKKDKGKTTLVNILAGKKTQAIKERQSIVREEVTLVKKGFSLRKEIEVKLHVWDMSGDEVYAQIYHSVFTPLTLYILVWDFWSITDEIDKIEKWINNIQASTSSFCVVLVGTFIDKLTPLKPDTVQIVKDRLVERLGDQTPRLCPVSCINNEGIEHLRTFLYETALCMTLPGRNRLPLIGRKIPKSYRLMEKQILEELKRLETEKKPLCLTQNQFLDIIERLPQKHNDLQSAEETAAVTKFLVEAGYLLHFSDQLGALDTLYFLDPAWLCDILVHVLISPKGKTHLRQGRGKISRRDAELIYKESAKFPSEFVDQYLELLERFEIAASISQSEFLFFPCQLPVDPPIIETADDKLDAKTMRRLYRMSDCPSGFWMRLVTRMMMRVEQFAKKDWHFRPIMTHSMRMMSMRHGTSVSSGPKRGGSFYGLQIKSARKTFCRELIHVSHEDGGFCVEPAIFTGSDNRDGLQNGVLITEVSKTGKFAIIGIIVDEIEDIIQDYYPGLLEPDMMSLSMHLERYALCSTCYQGQPLPNVINHFTMEHCARLLVNGDSITCPQGIKQELSALVPDLLMKELPDKYFMALDKLELKETKESCLGTGVTGSVFKGKYNGQAVAIKVYRSDIRNRIEAGKFASVNSNSSDSGTATLSTQGSVAEAQEEDIYVNVAKARRSEIDMDETESIKALRAIKEMRQEVAITSRLHHPCVVSLIGLAFRPKLMMALELAPLGSLRDILDKQTQGRPVFNRYKNKDELFPALFEKELIFKFVFQIAKGLEYLHTNAIIYKDLKSDNILTMSLDLSAPVNLKLSDYGISKFNWSGRSVGLVGTPGYQAPEILDGKAYDEKVDIFAFAMVIYEILTGRRPFAECDNLAQITKAMKIHGRRPNLKDFNVLTRFPWLEKTMKDCWQSMAQSRPAASNIVSKSSMQNLQYLAQTWVVDIPNNQKLSTNCVLGTYELDNRSLLCIWDGYKSERNFSILDPDWATFRVAGQKYDGPQVICMAQVGRHIWTGNQMIYGRGFHKLNRTVENTIVVYRRSENGSLEEVSTLPLDSCPVQILAVPARKGCGNGRGNQTGYRVYVALEQGSLLQFQSLTRNKAGESRHLRHTVRNIAGYSDPTACILRSRTIYCIAYSDVKQELWVSGNEHVDIVNCLDFKVNTDERINLTILLRMCKIHPVLCVGEMVCSGSQMFCMLAYSPFVLEFDTETYMCRSVLNLEKYFVIFKLVSKDFTEIDHEAYHGVTTEDWQGSANADISDHSDDSYESEDEPSESSNFSETANFWKSQQRAKSQPVSPEQTGDKLMDEPPLVPQRTRASRKALKVLGIEGAENVTQSCIESPVVPPRPPRPKTDLHGRGRQTPASQNRPPPIPPKGKTLEDHQRAANNKKVGKQTSFSCQICLNM
ncbi:leucine-rich repeat serine/threonine-protein kinase 1-like isoform X2 [Mercenaria mercenaria]|uniref:leucine-rich repeat serine/threonine-protein kinase 1-like isoform X2 n=1 Tax=Mercenaria mercenaria TaxID=6596 RepID=UPI00234F311A|nr:leucine-rich repeat serine/threonine-protein kinase 1-like isoform X2 [Mercenaria mercenaria]